MVDSTFLKNKQQKMLRKINRYEDEAGLVLETYGPMKSAVEDCLDCPDALAILDDAEECMDEFVKNKYSVRALFEWSQKYHFYWNAETIPLADACGTVINVFV